jgi:hypothetical protein
MRQQITNPRYRRRAEKMTEPFAKSKMKRPNSSKPLRLSTPPLERRIYPAAASQDAAE